MTLLKINARLVTCTEGDENIWRMRNIMHISAHVRVLYLFDDLYSKQMDAIFHEQVSAEPPHA